MINEADVYELKIIYISVKFYKNTYNKLLIYMFYIEINKVIYTVHKY